MTTQAMLQPALVPRPGATYRWPMAKFKNPKDDPSAEKLDLLKRLTGGETPGERIAKVEKEQKERPTRILDRVRKKS